VSVSDEEDAMKYVMVIYQGDALERQAALSEEERKQVYADYRCTCCANVSTPFSPSST
jgi:hypothetical protein